MLYNKQKEKNGATSTVHIYSLGDQVWIDLAQAASWYTLHRFPDDSALATWAMWRIAGLISWSTSKQTLWQVLPLGPTGFADSPYACLSAFAGNPLLINLDNLVTAGIWRQMICPTRPTFQITRSIMAL